MRLAPWPSILLLSLLIQLACERVQESRPAAENGMGSANTAPPPAAQDSKPVPAPSLSSPPAASGSSKPASAGQAQARLYAMMDFTVLRNLQILKARPDVLRRLAAQQGLLGKLVACGADPLSSLDRVQAILPSDFRNRLQGAVAAAGSFDATRVRSCLAGEFQKENYRHEARKDADVFIHPRLTFEIASPGPGRLQGASQDWNEREFPADVQELFRELGAGQALYVCSKGVLLPKHPEITTLALAFAPEQDSLAVRGRIVFTREDVAAALQAAVSAQIQIQRKNLAIAADPRMQQAARVLERLSLTREKDRLVLSAVVPYADVIPLLSLFNFKIRNTF